MSNKLSIGANPLSYMGVRPSSPSQFLLIPRAPTSNDIDYMIGTLWEDSSTNGLHILVEKTGSGATWSQLQTSAGGSYIDSLVGDDAAHADPDVSGDVTVAGGTNITTTGAIANTLQINLDDNIDLASVTAISFDTDVSTAGVTLSGITLQADGTDANIDINITPKGTGEVVLSNPLGAASGGTGLSSITDHSLIVGSGSSAVTELGVATDGQLPIGSTGSDPVLAEITGGAGISVTNGAGSITIDNTLEINAQTGTSYTLQLSDAGKLITLDNAAAITLNIPLNSSVAFPIGTQIIFQQLGAGTVTFTPAGGVTLQSANSLYDTATQYSVCAIIKVQNDVWILGGDNA